MRIVAWLLVAVLAVGIALQCAAYVELALRAIE
jgi:hypothetical protein